MDEAFEALRVRPGTDVDLATMQTRSDFGVDRDEADDRDDRLDDRLYAAQRRLWAEDERSLLVVFQAMDAGGKDGTIRRVFSGLNPQGVQVHGFKAPSDNEKDRDYLWRIHQVVPRRGEIGIFNRSHYEDVVVVRVFDWVDEATVERRYGHIRDFERMLVDEGTTILKFFLHISADEQEQRFRERLDRPEKRWKFNVGDLDVRRRWHDFMHAYSRAIAETSTDDAPWFVIPSDRKWARDLAVTEILTATLEGMDPQPPDPDPGLDDVTIPAVGSPAGERGGR